MANFTANELFTCGSIVFFSLAAVGSWFLLRRKRLMRNLLLVVFGMSAFAFVLVPMYNVLCQATGLNGKLDLAKVAATTQGIDYDRTITVEFVVAHNHDMPWVFKPKHTQIKVHPGELVTTAYYAKNLTDKTMVVQAIPSIAPSTASKYFKKVECFCFNQQKLGSGESANFGLRFYIDQDFPKNVQRITLAYTLFDISDKSKEWLCQDHTTSQT